MTHQQHDDFAEAWLAVMRHLKNYERCAALGDWQSAGESAAQIQLLAGELIAYTDRRLMPGTWETD